MKFAGELAALGTAVCWAAGSNLFATAGRRMGSATLNHLRVTVAMVLLTLTLLVLRGSPWPWWATGTQVALLGLSGLIGFVFGDAWFFRSLVILGPGRAALVASLVPLFTLGLAWPLLGETPGPRALLGMSMTMSGVAWVLLERAHAISSHVEGSALMGVLAGLLGAIGQAVGYVISKRALSSGLDPLSATVIRVTVAAAALWLVATLRGAPGRPLAALRDRRATAFMVAGSIAGPFLGVTLSLTALALIEAGVAASITAIFPLLTILIAWGFHRERPSLRLVAGSALAVAGVVVLFRRAG